MIHTAALATTAIFILVLIGIGFFYRHKKTSEDFFMAGRGVGVWRIVASTFTLVGAGEIVTLTAFAYLYGYTGLTLFLGFLLGAIFIAFFVNRYRKQSSEYMPYTVTDYVRQFVGEKSEKVYLVLQLVIAAALLLIQLVVGGLLIATLTGLSYPIAIAIIGLVVGIYISLGGLNSVLTTDVLQMIGMLVVLGLLVFLYNPAGGISELIALSQTHIIPSVDAIVLLVMGFFAILAVADVSQRVFAARTDAIARKSIVITGVLIMLFGALMLTLGLGIFAQFPEADPNNAFFDFLASSFSPLVLSLLAIFLTASIFSSADTELFISSILLSKLIKGKRELGRIWGQVMTWGIIIAMSILAGLFTNLVDIYFVLLFIVLIVGPVFLIRLFNRGNDLFASIGMVVSVLMLIIFFFNGLLVGWYPLLLSIPPLAGILVSAKRKGESVEASI